MNPFSKFGFQRHAGILKISSQIKALSVLLFSSHLALCPLTECVPELPVHNTTPDQKSSQHNSLLPTVPRAEMRHTNPSLMACAVQGSSRELDRHPHLTYDVIQTRLRQASLTLTQELDHLEILFKK